MILCVVGPTGIGKTALSIALAKHYDAEIINFDSMQVYEKLDIGTAKVIKEETEGIKHHLLSFVPLDKTYSVYDYQKDARKVIDTLQKEKKNIILVGGTGLYLKAVLYDYQFQDGTKEDQYEALSNEEIRNKILSYNIDNIPHVNNRKRLVRLLNKLENKEKITTTDKVLYPAIILGLTCKREVLYDRIDKRVDQMIEDGLVEEIKRVKDYFPVSKALQTGIGYKEFLPYLNKEQTLSEVILQIKKNSRHYAKRQYTFFKNQFPTIWYEVDFDNFTSTIDQVIKDIDNNKSSFFI